MSKQSAGLLMFRHAPDLQVLLVHPGGPFWAKKQRGAWTIPKGELEPGEVPLAAGIREFREETGFESVGPYLPLGSITQKSGKIVHAWAFQGDCKPEDFKCNLFKMEWPPRSGRFLECPEIDDARFFPLEEGLIKINTAQTVLLRRLEQSLLPADQKKETAGKSGRSIE